MIERLKHNNYLQKYCNSYFWRTYSGAEIDLIEECDGGLKAYEFKYGIAKRKAPIAWTKAYPSSEFTIIDQNSYKVFLGGS